MALFLGATGNDILEWRHVARLVEDLHERMNAEMATMQHGAEVPLLRELDSRLGEEIAFEEQFADDLSETLDAIDKEENDLLPLREELGRLAMDHFQRRGSVMAFHEICAAVEKRLVRRTLWFVEQWMAQHGFGALPGSYCWFVLGYPGRREGTVFCECENLLVFNHMEPERTSYFQVFARKAEELLTLLGLHTRIVMSPGHFSWAGSINEWRTRLSGAVSGQRKGDDMAALIELADLSPVHGDESLCEEMANMVQGMLSFHHGALRAVGRAASEMHTGLDFFGRMRIEKSGPHRGLFNLEQHALSPLICNVRLLALKCGVTSTNTVERIKGIMERGDLPVELAERLLLAFHHFSAQKIKVELKRGETGVWLDIDQLSNAEEQALRAGLETLVTLQRIAYQAFTEHG